VKIDLPLCLAFCSEGVLGGMEVKFHAFLTLALDDTLGMFQGVYRKGFCGTDGL